MAKRMPPFLRTQTEPVVASISSTELATQRGIVTLFAGETDDNKILSTTTFYSSYDKIATGGGSNGALDIDFDITLGTSTIIDGRVIINVPLGFFKSGGGSYSATCTGTLSKVVGGVETSLGTAVATVTKTIPAGSTAAAIIALDFVVSRQVLRKTNLIRLSIATSAPGANFETQIIHDPKGRVKFNTAFAGDVDLTSSLETGALTLNIPTILS